MRIMTTLIALAVSASAAAQDIPPAPNACSAFAKPTGPLNSEEYNRGFGGATGLNDDFHDHLADPLDVPGAVISSITREMAQDGEPGVTLLKDFVGLNCEYPYGA